RPAKAKYEAYQKAVVEQKAYERARKYFLEKRPISPLRGTPSYKYVKKMYKRQELVGEAPPSTWGKFDPSQAPGTYDPKSGTYISPEGYGMSVLPEYMPGYKPPPGTKIHIREAPDITTFPSFQELIAPKDILGRPITPKYELPPEPTFAEIIRERGIIPAVTPYVVSAKEQVIGGLGIIGRRAVKVVKPLGEIPTITGVPLGISVRAAREAIPEIGRIAERELVERIPEELLIKKVPEYVVPKYEGETGVWTPKGLEPPREIVIPEREEITAVGLIPKVANPPRNAIETPASNAIASFICVSISG
ncbi:unnamed protein product, partial [marine sediment metagenome]